MSYNDNRGFRPPTDLITSAQALTGSWADLGGEIDIFEFKTRWVAYFIDYTRNDSTGIKFRVLGKTEISGSIEYDLPLETDGATAVNLEPLVYTFTDGKDYTQVIVMETKGLIPVVQAQVMATTPGTTVGTIDVAMYSLAPLVEPSAYNY